MHVEITSYAQGGREKRGGKPAKVYRIINDGRVLIAIHLGLYADGIFAMRQDRADPAQFAPLTKIDIASELRSQGFTNAGTRNFDVDGIGDLTGKLGHLVFYHLGRENVRWLKPDLPEDFLKDIKEPKLKKFGPFKADDSVPTINLDDFSRIGGVTTKLVDGKLTKIVPPPPPPRETFYDDNPLYGAF